jgi:TolB-like protein/tetratricopeptide (TPR) repeat protein
VQAGLAYLLVGWLLIQVSDTTFDDIAFLPWWATPFLTILVIVGFPICLVLAWIFEYAEGRWYVDPGHETKPPTPASRRTYASVVGALAVAAIGLATYRVSVDDDSWLGEPPMTSVDGEAFSPDIALPIRENSIAILRFLNIDGDDDSQVFADGLAEDILDRLARIPGMRVSASRDSWSLDPGAESKEIRERLRVAYYLEGSVRIDGTAMRVVIELIDSSNGSIIHARSFDRVLDDLFDIQEEITRLIVASLRVALPQETQTILTIHEDSTDIDSYVLYRKGRTQSELPVTTLDPNYAAAHAGLCKAFVASYESTQDAGFVEAAEVACAKALATNANLDLVHNALGNLYWVTGRDFEAEQSFLSALEINANSVSAIQGLALVYGRQRRMVEAEQMHRRAIDLQPGNWRSINNLGRFYFNTGRYAEAANEYQQVVFLDRKNNWHGHGNLGTALMMAGDFERAIPALQKSLEIQPSRRFYSNLGVIYYYLGEFDKSVASHRNAVAMAPEDSAVWINLGDALQFSTSSREAKEAFAKAAELAAVHLDVNPKEVGFMLDLAWAEAMLGNTEYSGELIEQAIRTAPSNPFCFYYLALLQTRQGKTQEALNALEIAVEKGYPVVMLRSEPYLADLMREERFIALVGKKKTEEKDKG